MKYISKIGMMMAATGMLAATSCSDFSDYNSAADLSSTSASQSLWENISANAQVSDFAQVLQAVGYDEVLSKPTTYTVWAPVNGSFNKDSLLALANNAATKNQVITQFVYDHVANYSYKESDLEDSLVYMLSKKLIRFSNKDSEELSFDGKQLVKEGIAFNTPSSNGLLYLMKGAVPFRPNAYEFFFTDITKYGLTDSIFSKYVKKYEQVRLDENASVKGEIIDGKQIFDDSVTVTTNTFVTGKLRALLDSEDSTYTVVIPSDKAWNAAYEKIKKCYNYITPIAYQDLASTDVEFAGKKGGTCPTTKTGKATILSATAGAATSPATLEAAPSGAEIQDTKAYWTDSITKRNIVNNTAFSENNKHYNAKLSSGAAFAEGDSLYSTTGNKLTNLVNLDAVTALKQNLSNGHARVVNDYPYHSFETYAKKITTRNPGRVVTASGYSYENMSIDKSKLDPKVCILDNEHSSLKYVKATLPNGSNVAPELDFYLPNVLSTTYNIYAVMVPEIVEDDSSSRPYTLRFDLHYTDASNTPRTGRLNGDTIIMSNDIVNLTKVSAFETDPSKVDTLYLGHFKFPICYYGTAAAPNIKVMSTYSTFSTTIRKKYDSQLRIADIILKPVDLVEFENKATKED